MEINFQRSKALNNIPNSKVQEKLHGITFNCEECKGKNIKDGDALCKKCSYQSIAFTRYAESNIPIEYWPLKMEKDFKGDPRLLNKYTDIVNDLKNNFIKGYSVCFAGNHGVGKTFTSTNILKKAVVKGYSALYSTLSDVVNVLIQSPNEEKYYARKELTMVDFLVLDEWDVRFMPNDLAADLYARTLESIFRTRISNNLPTIMCTNSPNALEAFNGPLKQSMESLTKGYMDTFIVLGSDYRESEVKK